MKIGYEGQKQRAISQTRDKIRLIEMQIIEYVKAEKDRYEPIKKGTATNHEVKTFSAWRKTWTKEMKALVKERKHHLENLQHMHPEYQHVPIKGLEIPRKL